MGARCKDGSILVGDRKITSTAVPDVVYANKITGEINGALTAFAGDRGTFELFRNRLRHYAKTIDEQRNEKNGEVLNVDGDVVL